MSKLKNEVMLGGFIVAAGGLLAFMSVAVGGFNMAPGVHVEARFENAAGLVKDAAIMVAGVEVGHIESLSVDHDKAVVKMFIRKDAAIRKDVEAAVRAKSLLGEKYVELIPQSKSAPMIASGDRIDQTRSTVEVDELLASLGPVIKQIDPKDVSTIVRVVAKTMNDEQGNMAAIVANAAAISEQVNETLAANRRNIDKVVANAATMTEEGSAFLTAKRPEIERTVSNLDKVSSVLSAEAPALAKKANRIAATVDEMTTTLNADAPRLTKQLGKVADKLPGTLDELSGIKTSIDRTLDKANPLLDKANAFDAAKMRELAQEVLIKNGVKVYMHPFGPGENDFKKLPQQ